MVQVVVNPGRKVRDKVRGRDAAGGEVIEVRDVERKILLHRGYVSDPGPPVAEGTPPKPAPEPAPAEPEVVRNTHELAAPRGSRQAAAEPEGSAPAAGESELEVAQESAAPSGEADAAARRRRYQRRDITATEE